MRTRRTDRSPPREAISYRTFFRAARRTCRTLSACWRPTKGERIWRYRTRTSALYERQLYPVRFVDRRGKKLLGWNDPRAYPIGLLAFVSRFAGKMRNGKAALGLPRRLTIFLLTCIRCERSVIVDGNHRMTRLAKRLKDVPVTVYELAGKRWSRKTPDVNVICACMRSSRKT